jgi:hypothetical protein
MARTANKTVTETKNAPAPEKAPASKPVLVEKPLDKLTPEDIKGEKKAIMEQLLTTSEAAVILAGHNLSQSAWDIGMALKRIKEERLYLARGCKDWKDYIASKQEWKMSRQAADDYINLTNLTKEQIGKLGISAGYVVGAISQPEVREKTVEKVLETLKHDDLSARKTIEVVRKEADKARKAAGVEKGKGGRKPQQSEGPKQETKEVTTPSGRHGVKDKYILDLKELADGKGGWDLGSDVFAFGDLRIKVTVNVDEQLVRLDIIH